MITLNTAHADETLALGQWIGQRLPVPAVVGLDGDLGTGKTWMAKGLVRGIGDYDDEFVKSPAYNLIHEYRVATATGTVSVFHIDFYRLDALSDTDYLLFSEYLERPDAICLVEWASKFLKHLVPGYLSLTLSLCGLDTPTCRAVQATTVGDAAPYHTLLTELPHYAHADP